LEYKDYNKIRMVYKRVKQFDKHISFETKQIDVNKNIIENIHKIYPNVEFNVILKHED
jgi:hypothetical protein